MRKRKKAYSPASVPSDNESMQAFLQDEFERIASAINPEVGRYLVANLPSAAFPVRMIFVIDEAGGAVVAFNDGTNWRRVTDRAVVS